MTVVQNTANTPGGPLQLGLVTITLVTGDTTTPGYTATGDIAGSYTTKTDMTGHWSLDLTPNTSITPANTYYRVLEGTNAVSLISVPASGGPYNLSQVLVTPPPTPGAPGITGVQVAAGGTVAGVRPGVNLVAGSGIAVSAADNPSANRVDVTVTSTAANPWQFPITNYGAVGDLQCVIDGAMNNSAVLTSATANWTSTDVGKPIVVKGALTSGKTSLVATIASRQSATQVTLSAAATATAATGLQVLWGSDDTAAIQAAIDAAVAYKSPFGIGSEIVTPAAASGAGYMIAGPLKTTDGVNPIYNSQLTLGLNSGRNAGRDLVFSGALDAGNTRYWDQDYPALGSSTWFSTGVFASQAAQATSVSTSGNPSVLGGPTGKNGYGSSGADPTFNNVTVALRDMTILTPHSASGWTYSPFNFHGMARAHLDRCSFGTTGVVQLYKTGGLGDFADVTAFENGISIGGLMPAAGNNASNRIRDCVWNGGYTYGPLWTEHTVGEGVNTILYCWGGFCPVGVYGDGGVGAGALHAINAGQLAVEGCAYHMVVWGPGQSGSGPTVHAILDIEGSLQLRDNPSDGTGLAAANGTIRLAGASSAPSLTFPTGLKLIREQIASGVNGSPPALAANTAVCNTLYRPAEVYLSGGTTVTTVQVSILAGGAGAPAVATVADFTASGTVPTGTSIRVGPGQWVKVNCSVLPSAVWVLD